MRKINPDRNPGKTNEKDIEKIETE